MKMSSGKWLRKPLENTKSKYYLRFASPSGHWCVFLDQQRGQDGSRIYRTGNFDYPLQRNASGSYRIKPGELIRVCMTADFFLEEADPWSSFHDSRNNRLCDLSRSP